MLTMFQRHNVLDKQVLSGKKKEHLGKAEALKRTLEPAAGDTAKILNKQELDEAKSPKKLSAFEKRVAATTAVAQAMSDAAKSDKNQSNPDIKSTRESIGHTFDLYGGRYNGLKLPK